MVKMPIGFFAMPLSKSPLVIDIMDRKKTKTAMVDRRRHRLVTWSTMKAPATVEKKLATVMPTLIPSCCWVLVMPVRDRMPGR